MEKGAYKRPVKKISYLIIIAGFSFILIMQTWLSVLNAQQAYTMNEARSDETKILRVVDRLEEFKNYFSSSEYLYIKSYEESKIILTPKGNVLNSEAEPATWNMSPTFDESFAVKERELNNFLEIYDTILPEKGKKYFTPLSETLSSSPFGKPVIFIEHTISLIISWAKSLGSGFNIQNVSESLHNFSENKKLVDSAQAISEPKSGDGIVGLLPSPDTR